MTTNEKELWNALERVLRSGPSTWAADKQHAENVLKQTAPEPEKHWVEVAWEKQDESMPRHGLTPDECEKARHAAFLAGVKAGFLHAKEKLCYVKSGCHPCWIHETDMQQRLLEAADSVPEEK